LPGDAVQLAANDAGPSEHTSVRQPLAVPLFGTSDYEEVPLLIQQALARSDPATKQPR
jgi:hypothetical protein